MYVIEKNVPIPENTRPYTFIKDMEVGDSILVKTHKECNSLRQQFNLYNKKNNTEFKCKSYKSQEGHRIWRIK